MLTKRSSGRGDTLVVRIKVSTHLKVTNSSPLSLVRSLYKTPSLSLTYVTDKVTLKA